MNNEEINVIYGYTDVMAYLKMNTTNSVIQCNKLKLSI